MFAYYEDMFSKDQEDRRDSVDHELPESEDLGSSVGEHRLEEADGGGRLDLMTLKGTSISETL